MRKASAVRRFATFAAAAALMFTIPTTAGAGGAGWALTIGDYHGVVNGRSETTFLFQGELTGTFVIGRNIYVGRAILVPPRDDGINGSYDPSTNTTTIAPTLLQGIPPQLGKITGVCTASWRGPQRPPYPATFTMVCRARVGTGSVGTRALQIRLDDRNPPRSEPFDYYEQNGTYRGKP